MEGCLEFSKYQNRFRTTYEDSDACFMVQKSKIIFMETNFDSLLSTIVLFIEQDIYLNVILNLDIISCCVCQGN